MVWNDNTTGITVPAGTTIVGNTFSSNGIYTIGTTYTGSNTAVTSGYPRVAISWGDTPKSSQSKETSLNADSIIESLFRLNPAAKKKFKGDKAAFAKAIVAAAEAQEQRKALDTLSALGLAE